RSGRVTHGQLGKHGSSNGDHAHQPDGDEQGQEAPEPNTRLRMAAEIIEEDAEDQPRQERNDVEHYAGQEAAHDVHAGPETHQAPEEPPGGHTNTSARPARRRWLKRDAGSAARAFRRPYSTTRPSSRIRM